MVNYNTICGNSLLILLLLLMASTLLFSSTGIAKCRRQISDPNKREFAEELFSYTDTFNKTARSSLEGDGNEARAAFHYFETPLSKFNDGPFLQGQFSLADIACAPFIERCKPFLLEVKKYDITAGRPQLATWIEAKI
ncbi:glutathione S-transferase L2, chloroplastic-like isoform X2 [Citrus sinensis]|uniref:glutathione S-transferase L2, chloroplastic-like isoform X2 n=1 Tax=Citrus sinensis TaxID=2711 RepID=UPI0022786DBF|nr:glutathione S-transferase L2, chloroplastic-like isoform X2 [Citrus sinensis]